MSGAAGAAAMMYSARKAENELADNVAVMQRKAHDIEQATGTRPMNFDEFKQQYKTPPKGLSVMNALKGAGLGAGVGMAGSLLNIGVPLWGLGLAGAGIGGVIGSMVPRTIDAERVQADGYANYLDKFERNLQVVGKQRQLPDVEPPSVPSQQTSQFTAR